MLKFEESALGSVFLYSTNLSKEEKQRSEKSDVKGSPVDCLNYRCNIKNRQL